MVHTVFLHRFSIKSSKYTSHFIMLHWSIGQSSGLQIRRLQVRILLPSAKVILLLKFFIFSHFFQKVTFNTKNRHSSNTFWSLQHGVKKLQFLSYSHLKQQLLIWVTLYIVRDNNELYKLATLAALRALSCSPLVGQWDIFVINKDICRT